MLTAVLPARHRHARDRGGVRRRCRGAARRPADRRRLPRGVADDRRAPRTCFRHSCPRPGRARPASRSATARDPPSPSRGRRSSRTWSSGPRRSTPRARAALAAASDVDVVVMLAGRVTGEAMDADSLELPAGQAALIDALAATGVPVVVVTHGAGPIVMPWRERVGSDPARRPPRGAVRAGARRDAVGPARAGRQAAAHGAGRGRRRCPPPPPTRKDASSTTRAWMSAIGGTSAATSNPRTGSGTGWGTPRSTFGAWASTGPMSSVTVGCGSDRGGKAVVQLYARKAAGETLALVGFAPVRLACGRGAHRARARRPRRACAAGRTDGSRPRAHCACTSASRAATCARRSRWRSDDRSRAPRGPMLGRFIVENELSWFTGVMPPDAR